MTTALPFRLIGDADLSALRSAFRMEMGKWAATWFAAMPEADFHASADSGQDIPASGQWMILGSDADTWVAWQLTSRPWRDYARLLLNAPIGPNAFPTPLVESLLQECLLDLANRLLSAAGRADSLAGAAEGSLDKVRTGYGSGAVLGYLCGDLPRQAFALGGTVVAGLVGERNSPPLDGKSLVPREAAVTAGTTRLEVVLGQAELTLAELANVSPGDVIRLQSPFREPLTVRASDGRTLVRARLGTRADHKAIQVIEKTS